MDKKLKIGLEINLFDEMVLKAITPPLNIYIYIVKFKKIYLHEISK